MSQHVQAFPAQPAETRTEAIATQAAGSVVHRPVRITYLITDLEIGGVPLHLLRLAANLPSNQFLPRVISLADEGPVGEQLRAAGIDVSACRARSPLDLAALIRLHGFLRRHRPEILHSLLFHANVAARLVGPLAGIPVNRILTEIQTVETERRWHLKVDNLTCRLCRCEIGNSASVIEHLHQYARVPRTRLRCEWGAVDLHRISSTPPIDRAALGVAPDAALVVWTGRLDPVKGFEEMLAAFRRATTGRHAHLLLAGEGPYRKHVEQLIVENQLEDSVTLVGARSDVPALLRAADLFLFTSRTEGLPNSVLEAMAAGLPIVATDIPGCRDLIEHRETGLLVEAGSVPCIASGMSELLDNRLLAKSLGDKARVWIGANADLPELVSRWVAYYHSILMP